MMMKKRLESKSTPKSLMQLIGVMFISLSLQLQFTALLFILK
jgi:hypothetical protein